MEKFDSVVPVDQSQFAKNFLTRGYPESFVHPEENKQELDLVRDFTLYQLSFKNIIFGLVAVNNKASDDLAELQKQVCGIKKYKHPFHDAVRISPVSDRYGYKWLGQAIANYVGQSPIQVHSYINPDQSVGMLMCCPRKALRKGFVNAAVWQGVNDLDGVKFGKYIYPILEAGGFTSVEKV